MEYDAALPSLIKWMNLASGKISFKNSTLTELPGHLFRKRGLLKSRRLIRTILWKNCRTAGVTSSWPRDSSIPLVNFCQTLLASVGR